MDIINIKCNTCQFRRTHFSNFDEYPPNTAIEYCTKGHWEGDGEADVVDTVDVWADCPDYVAVGEDHTSIDMTFTSDEINEIKNNLK